MTKIYTLLFALVLFAEVSFAQVKNPQLEKYTAKLKLPGFVPLNLKPHLNLRPIANQDESNRNAKMKAAKEKQSYFNMPVLKPQTNRNFSLLGAQPDSATYYHLRIKEVK